MISNKASGNDQTSNLKSPDLYRKLFTTFFKIGAFTLGGGYAMISLIEHLCVEREGWIAHDDMMNVVVIAESTPGPIAINCATFVGYRQAGLGGALAAENLLAAGDDTALRSYLYRPEDVMKPEAARILALSARETPQKRKDNR